MNIKKGVATWWLLLLAGLMFIIIGVLCFVTPFRTYINLAAYSGFALFLNGIFLAIIASNAKYVREKNWLIAECLVDFVFGTGLVFNPLFTFIVFPLLIGPWVFSKGAVKMAASIALKKIIKGWKFIFAAGLLSLCFGLFIIFNPIAKANGITIAIGAFGLTIGALNIFDAFRFKNAPAEVNMMF